MKLNLSVGTSDRIFGKAMRRIYPILESCMSGFEKAVPSINNCDAILVGITDDKPPDYFEEVANHDAYFQVLVGCPFPLDDSALVKAVYERVRRTVSACPMSSEDRLAAMTFLDDWERGTGPCLENSIC